MVEEVKTPTTQSIFYNNKIKTNPEFYEKEKKRVTEYMVKRYNNDEEYKQKRRESALKSYYNRKNAQKTFC